MLPRRGRGRSRGHRRPCSRVRRPDVHAVNPGATGNIQAGDIHAACCRENIFAYNSAFSGGADQRDYTIVTQHDIQGVVSSLVPTLTLHIQTSFQEQIHPGETLTPNLCSQNVSPDHNAGDEATQVTVRVTESCLAGAYSTTDLRAKVQQALTQQAEQRIGMGYLLSSYFPTSSIKTNIQHGTLVMSAIYQATMIFHFSSHELTTLRQHLAGKSRQQGIAMLSHLNGVERVSLQVKGTNGKLPTNAASINILFVIENTS